MPILTTNIKKVVNVDADWCYKPEVNKKSTFAAKDGYVYSTSRIEEIFVNNEVKKGISYFVFETENSIYKIHSCNVLGRMK